MPQQPPPAHNAVRPHLAVHPAYMDVNGRYAGEEGFIQPGYSSDYRDINGKRPGQSGFIPPPLGTRTGCDGMVAINTMPLPEGCYDENYYDAEGRRPGDKGFTPPRRAVGIHFGYDERYRYSPGDHAPLPTSASTLITPPWPAVSPYPSEPFSSMSPSWSVHTLSTTTPPHRLLTWSHRSRDSVDSLSIVPVHTPLHPIGSPSGAFAPGVLQFLTSAVVESAAWSNLAMCE